MTTIKGQAFVYTRYGSPGVVRPVAINLALPQADQVLIEVQAASISSADWRLRSLTMPKGMGWLGRPAVGFFGPRKKVLGTECSGVVVEKGPKVTRFDVGDPVIAFPGTALGAHATHLLMSQTGNIALKPRPLSFEQAAGLCFAGTTAYDYLRRKGAVHEGDRILVNGASGAVGLAVLQIAAAQGAHVTAICSAQNAALVRRYGAQDVIAYDQQEVTANEAPFDVVVDVVGTIGWQRSKPLLRQGGQMLLIAGHAKDMVFGPLMARLTGYRLISGVAGEDRALFDAVITLAELGKLQPVIDRIYEFDEMTEAHQYVDTGHKKGAVIVRMARYGETPSCIVETI